MAEFVNYNAYLSVNAVDLSDHVRSLTFNEEVEEQDSTAMNPGANKSSLPGLRGWSVDVEFNQDFAASKVHATLSPIARRTSTDGPVAIEVRQFNTTVSATNPKRTGTVWLFGYSPFDGAAGDAATVSVTFTGTGGYTESATP